MKHLKTLGLALVAAAAFMAFAGNASATILTSPAGTEYTGTLTATAAETLTLKAGFATITCTESTVSGKVETNGDAGKNASGKITTLDYSNCGSSTVDPIVTEIVNDKEPVQETKFYGKLEVEATGSETGVVKGSGSEVTVSALGTSCVYGTAAGTTLGTVTGGNPATMTISASLPKISGGFLCGNPAAWSGKYTVTTPKPLLIDKN